MTGLDRTCILRIVSRIVLLSGLLGSVVDAKEKASVASGRSTRQVVVSNVHKIFDNGEHNAFTDIVKFRGRYYLTFRSCPDGHMVHPTASIIVLSSQDLKKWTQVCQFSVPERDTRDPHFLKFKGQLFVLTGTWYCGEASPKREDYDLNKHLGYAVFSKDGQSWSSPTMLEGTFGHYIWRANAQGGLAYLCGRRKHEFDARPRGEGPDVESAMLVSEDGLVWRTHSLFQTEQGDETAFQFATDGSALAISRRGSKPAEVLHAQSPYSEWQRVDLDRYIGGPLLARWGNDWIVGGRNQTADGPKTQLCWLDGQQLVDMAQLPSGGDNSYPGFVALTPEKGFVTWYSSHEKNASGQTITAIYGAEISRSISRRKKFSFNSSYDGTEQMAYLTTPHDQGMQPEAELRPAVVSLHSWSGNLEQRHGELELLAAERGWYCLQPNFRGVNDDPLACGSEAAQRDIIDAVDWMVEHHSVDPQRVYLTGNSGGGHMTMMMAAKYPDRWAAASAWVGISDMSTWYEKHKDGRYGAMTRACCGGEPQDSAAIAQQYHDRSPIHFLSGAKGVAIDLAAGLLDGHTGSVPIRHTLDAFNVIAKASGAQVVSEAEIQQLSKLGGRLEAPQIGDLGFDASFGRDFYLRRFADNARVTIFDGGHEGIAQAAIAWFEHGDRP